MDSEADPPKIIATRHKCAACYKQYKKKEHLVEHMKVSYHSVHQPKCGICQKHCKSFESLREHITGPLPKGHCSKIFAERGCDLCLKIIDSPAAVSEHKRMCCLLAPVPLVSLYLNFSYEKVFVEPEQFLVISHVTCQAVYVSLLVFYL